MVPDQLYGRFLREDTSVVREMFGVSDSYRSVDVYVSPPSFVRGNIRTKNLNSPDRKSVV